MLHKLFRITEADGIWVVSISDAGKREYSDRDMALAMALAGADEAVEKGFSVNIVVEHDTSTHA